MYFGFRVHKLIAALPLMLGLLAGCKASQVGASDPAITPSPGLSAGDIQASADSVLQGGPLQALLEDLKAKASPEQSAQIWSAINASPPLIIQLNGLAKSGQLERIDIGSAEPFGARADKKRIILMPDYLKALAQSQPAHVRPADGVAPNNLTFVLGHLAYHLAKASPPMSAFNSPMSYAQARIADEAASDIQGWNDTIGAAEKENGGKQLSVPQVGYILASLRYRAVFLKADQSNPKLAYAQTGRIELNPQNLAAVVTAIASTNVRDYE